MPSPYSLPAAPETAHETGQETVNETAHETGQGSGHEADLQLSVLPAQTVKSGRLFSLQDNRYTRTFQGR